jgi:hypothetical protein
LSIFIILLEIVISLDLINYNRPSLDIREFLFLDSGLGWDPELLSLDNIFSYNTKIFIRLLYNLLDIRDTIKAP